MAAVATVATVAAVAAVAGGRWRWRKGGDEWWRAVWRVLVDMSQFFHRASSPCDIGESKIRSRNSAPIAEEREREREKKRTDRQPDRKLRRTGRRIERWTDAQTIGRKEEREEGREGVERERKG